MWDAHVLLAVPPHQPSQGSSGVEFKGYLRSVVVAVAVRIKVPQRGPFPTSRTHTFITSGGRDSADKIKTVSSHESPEMEKWTEEATVRVRSCEDWTRCSWPSRWRNRGYS